MARAVALTAAGLTAAGLVAPGLAVASAGPSESAGSTAPFVASTSPCSPAPGSSICTRPPATVAGTWPSGVTVGGVVVSWDGTGRPAGAPTPQTTSVPLPTSAATCNASADGTTTTCAWPWPAGLASGSTILNGTYRVDACATTPSGSRPASGCQAPGGFTPATVALGVPPATPGGFVASADASGTVALRWAPAPEADVTGYQVARDGAVTYSCSSPWATGAAPVCSPSPAASDSPRPGTHVYTLTAERSGPAPSASYPASPPATATVVVAGPTGPATPIRSATLPPVPYVGPVRTLPLGAPPTSQRPATATDPGYNSSLTFTPGTTPAGEAAATSEALAAAPDRAATAAAERRQVKGTSLFAVGMLLLAAAAHLIYIRAEIARRDAVFRALGVGPRPGRRKRPRSAPGTAPVPGDRPPRSPWH